MKKSCQRLMGNDQSPPWHLSEAGISKDLAFSLDKPEKSQLDRVEITKSFCCSFTIKVKETT